MREVAEWIGGVLILTYAFLTIVKFKRRRDLEAEYRTACAKCGGEYENNKRGLYCDDCGGAGDSS